MSLQSWKEEFEGKKILIYGFGLEGRGTYQLIRRLCPDLEITIADGGKGAERAKEETTKTIVISDHNLNLSEYDLVMKSPGIVLKEGTDLSNISGEAQLFLKHYRNQTIGITGTKGKSTTTSLVAALLKEQYKVELVGNIGRSCFDVIDEMEDGALAAFEISCHQLEYCNTSPHIGVYLNLYEEHLDHYGSFKKYGDAKSHVFTNQEEGDIAILNQELTQYIPKSLNKPVLIGKDIYNKDKHLYIPGKDLEIKECNLIGNHNYTNLAVAYYIASLYGIRDEQVKHAAKTFSPLHHRLEDLGEKDGIRYVNDSISTIGQATIQALKALKNVETVLVGGMDRGIEYHELEEYLSKEDVKVIFMYATGHRIHKEMKENNQLREHIYEVEDLEAAVNLAKEITSKGNTILLSPAASSYDHFKNFEERGDIFKSLTVGE